MEFFLLFWFIYRGGKNSVQEKFQLGKLQLGKFCPNPYFAWKKLLPRPTGSGKRYIDRREAPEVFDSILTVIGFFVKIKFDNP